jgi:hypothetical protein
MKAPSKIESLNDLRELQRAMAGALFLPLTEGDRMQRANTKAANAIIAPNDRLSSFERLEIYNRQYWFRLLDCLYDDFPGLRAVLGERKFHQLCRAYLAKYPSESFTLRNLGSRLPQFIRDEPQWTKPRNAIALDMVAFEWAQIIAFDSSALPPFTVDDFLGQNPAELRFVLQPHLTLLALDYPVDHVVLALKERTATRGDASNAVSETASHEATRAIRLPKKEAVFVVVHRHELDLYYKRLEPEAFALLCALRDGATLEAACEHAILSATREVADWSAQIRAWFENWAALGWFCKTNGQPQ